MVSNYRRISVVLVAVSLVAAAISTIAANFRAPESFEEVRFNGWSYQRGTDPDGATTVAVNFDRSTVTALEQYAQVNRRLAKQLVADGEKTANVLVTFRRPVNIDEFRTWASSGIMSVVGFQIRLTTPNGIPYTLFGAHTNGELVSQVDVQRNLDNLASRRGATEVKGVIVADGRIDLAAYDRLTNDPRVFIADVTRTVVSNHLKQTVPGIDLDKVNVRVAPLYGSMEQLGLVQAS